MPVTTLDERAMLGSLNMSVWTAKIHDREISDEIARKHQIAKNMGQYNKHLLGEKAIKKISNLAAACRNDFYRLSLPWDDNGQRILTSAGYFKLTEIMRKREDEFAEAKREFIANYPDLKEEAKTLLNGSYNEDDYPTVSQVASKFRFRFRIAPLPVSNDFRVAMANTDAEAIRKQIADAVADAQANAMRDVWGRMKEVVSNLAQKLKDYTVKPDGKVENAFRDSLVGNIKSLLEIIPALNLTDDQNVKAFAAEMEDLIRYDPYTLRDNEGTRKLITKQANDILARMEAFV